MKIRNRIGLVTFGIGFIGVLIFGSGLDSPAEGFKIAVMGMAVSALVATIGYLLMDIDEVLNGAGLSKTKDSREVAERKARNREATWNNWIHGGYIN